MQTRVRGPPSALAEIFLSFFSILLSPLLFYQKGGKRVPWLKRKRISEMNVPQGRIGVKKAGPLAPVKSVLFIDNTVGGELARRLQEAEVDLGKATGYRVRVTESAGTPLGMLLLSTNPWGPADCGRGGCVPCAQQDKKRNDCKKRNILYENRCTLCNTRRMESS